MIELWMKILRLFYKFGNSHLGNLELILLSVVSSGRTIVVKAHGMNGKARKVCENISTKIRKSKAFPQFYIIRFFIIGILGKF